MLLESVKICVRICFYQVFGRVLVKFQNKKGVYSLVLRDFFRLLVLFISVTFLKNIGDNLGDL